MMTHTIGTMMRYSQRKMMTSPTNISEVLDLVLPIPEHHPMDTLDKLNLRRVLQLRAEVEAHFKRLVKEEVIGEDVKVNPHLANVNPQEAQNRLKAKQRQQLEEKL